MSDKIEVTVKVGENQVTLAGPEEFVRAEVQRLTNIIAASSPSVARSATQTRVAGPDDLPASEAEFVKEKKPHGHSEIVAVLAFLLTKKGQIEFNDAEMRRAYARARQRPPKVMGQALRDAKNSNDYLEPGTKRGTFRLSPHGERTVAFDLPRKERLGRP